MRFLLSWRSLLYISASRISLWPSLDASSKWSSQSYYLLRISTFLLYFMSR